MKPDDPIRVLVIDDDEAICDSMRAYLEDQDYDVWVAYNAERALAMLPDLSIEVAIVDLRLPGMSGIALIEAIHNRYPNIRFLIHTGSIDFSPSKHLQAIGVRAVHIFLKPVLDLQLVVNAIDMFELR